MNRSQIQAAIEKKVPFAIRMADGHEYQVPHQDYIALPPVGSFVIVFDDQERAHYLPLLTMTGLVFPSAAKDAKS
jgi:hypothetical protein